MSRCLRNQNGMTLIEVVIVSGIMVVTALAMSTMMTNQAKATRYLETQLKREQLRMVLIGQFLRDPNNCKCLFFGASDYPAAGAPQLGGTAPTALGDYVFTTPGDCTTATMPVPYIDSTGIDGMKVTSIKLADITPTNGFLEVKVQSTKEVLGPDVLRPIRIPVSVTSVPSGANRSFQSCSGTGGGAVARCRLALETFDNDTCSGNTMLTYSDWNDPSVPGVTWTDRDAFGNPVGRNRNPGDIACMRVGIECQP